MWSLYLTAKLTTTRPSDLVLIEDRWAALQFDNAVRFVGTLIENTLMEREEVKHGKSTKFIEKYKLEQLLDPDFRFPSTKQGSGAQAFVNSVKQANLRNLKYVKVK